MPVDSVDVALWNVVETLDYKVYVSQPEGYAQKQKTQIDWNSVKEVLELEEIDGESLYTWSETTEDWKPELLTNKYTCTPFPGFWMGETGEVPSSFNDQCTYGYTVAPSTGEITWYVHPNAGKQTGDTYKCEMFFVNVRNGKVARVVVDLEFYNERATITTVGTKNVNVNLDDYEKNADDLYEIPFEINDICEKVGTSLDYYDECSWYTEDKAMEFWRSVENFEMDNTWFNAEGVEINPADENAKPAFTLGYDVFEEKLLVSLFEPLADDTAYTAKVAFGYNGKCYVFTINIGSAVALGVEGIAAGNKPATVSVDMLGRKVGNEVTVPSVKIINGKKYLIKK